MAVLAVATSRNGLKGKQFMLLTFYRNASVNSKVLSTTVYPHPVGELAEPVEIVLTHLKKPNATEPECVFWKVNER